MPKLNLEVVDKALDLGNHTVLPTSQSNLELDVSKKVLERGPSKMSSS